MFRLAALALLVTAFAIAAPVPKEKGKELYFPVVKGTKMVMVSKSGDTTQETVETVTAVEEKDGVYTVTTESKREGNSRTSTRTVEVSEKRVFQKSANGREQKDSNPILKGEGKAGDTWTTESTFGKRTYTVGKEEEIEVPAGKYKAVRMDTEMVGGGGGQTIKTSQWHAPGVGLVKSVVTDPRGIQTIFELKEFTPGKEEKKDDKKKEEPKKDK